MNFKTSSGFLQINPAMQWLSDTCTTINRDGRWHLNGFIVCHTPHSQGLMERKNSSPSIATGFCDSGYFPLKRWWRVSVCVRESISGGGEAPAWVNEAAGTFGRSRNILRLTENGSSKITNIQMLHSSSIIHSIPSFLFIAQNRRKEVNLPSSAQQEGAFLIHYFLFITLWLKMECWNLNAAMFIVIQLLLQHLTGTFLAALFSATMLVQTQTDIWKHPGQNLLAAVITRTFSSG